MKTLKTLLLTAIMVLLLAPTRPAHAQTGATDAGFQKLSNMLSSDTHPFAGGETIEIPADLPGSYQFALKYRLQFSIGEQDNEGSINYDYYLNPDVRYVGYTTSETAGMIAVLDFERDAKIAYLQEEESPVAIPLDIPEMMESGQKPPTRDQIKELPDKEFLGYTAKGIRIEQGETTTIIYITTEAGVSFLEFIPGIEKTISAGFDHLLGEGEKGVMMYMESTGPEYGNLKVIMECTLLQEESLVIQNSTYTFL